MVGVLDSGMGALATEKEIRRLYPRLNLLIFRDRENAPYGTKSTNELTNAVERGVRHLLNLGANRVVLGCCTASTVWELLPEEIKPSTIPIIQPTVNLAQSLTKNGKIALIATKGTVERGAFSTVLGNSLVCSLPLQELVYAIEEGARDGRISKHIGHLLDEALAPLGSSGADTLILGCTHFPLLKGEIMKRTKKYGIKYTASSALAAAHELDKYQDCTFYESGLTVSI